MVSMLFIIFIVVLSISHGFTTLRRFELLKPNQDEISLSYSHVVLDDFLIL